MPEPFEIIEEARNLRDTFEVSWQLPWYAGPKDPVWSHRLVQIMLELPDDTFDDVMRELLDDDPAEIPEPIAPKHFVQS